jgi:serine/threonine-protein kinase RsbW
LTQCLLQAAIESRFDNVWLIGVMVRAVANHLGFSCDDSMQLELAIVEALNNSIEHAYEGQDGNKVEFSLQCRHGALEFIISDRGVPFPADIDISPPETALPEDPSELLEGGRGIAIIRAVMDSVRYRRCGDRNELCLSKRLAV